MTIKSDTIDTVKSVAETITQIGTTQIVVDAINTLSPVAKLGPFKRFARVVGGIAIAGVIGAKACEYVSETIDEVIDILTVKEEQLDGDAGEETVDNASI